MQKGRVKNVSRNMIFGGILKVYQIITPFIIRTIMIYSLGIEYVGLNSLFASVLQVLNLAELGVGSAMVFSMYEPIAQNDHITICALMKLYKIYYRIIGIIILGAGIIVLPFIPHLISGEVPGGLNVYTLYILNLLATVFSYWLFAYKSCLLTAFQRNDIISRSLLVVSTIQYATQIVVLVVWKNYYLFLLLALSAVLLNNVLTAFMANRLYPDLQPKGKLDTEVVKNINQKVKDLFTAKIGGVVVNSADTIVISAFLGLTALAVYQNYYYILSAVMGINQVIYKACLASIGNSMVLESKEKNYCDFKMISMLFMWLIGFCTTCFACLFQPFMEIWVGKDLMLSYLMVILFCTYFYLCEIMSLFSLYKDAAGIWHQDRFRPLIEAGANLVVNLILVKPMGLYGILISTIISMCCISIPWLYRNLFKYVFDRSVSEYTKIFLGGTAIMIFVTTGVALLTRFIPLSGNIGLFVRLLTCIIVSNTLYYLLFKKFETFAKILLLINRITGKRIFKVSIQ